MEEKEIMAAEDDQATTAVETNQATTVEVEEEEEAAKETVSVDSLAVAVARSQEVALEDWVEV